MVGKADTVIIRSAMRFHHAFGSPSISQRLCWGPMVLVGASSPQSQELWVQLRSMGSLQSDRTRRDRSLCGRPCGGPPTTCTCRHLDPTGADDKMTKEGFGYKWKLTESRTQTKTIDAMIISSLWNEPIFWTFLKSLQVLPPGLNNKMTKGDIHLVVNVNHRLHRSFILDFLWFYPPGPHLVRGAQSF